MYDISVGFVNKYALVLGVKFTFTCTGLAFQILYMCLRIAAFLKSQIFEYMNRFVVFVDPCKKVVCEFFSKCIRKEDNTAECACPVCDVDEKYSPVCGTDAKTYASECQLKSIACREKKNTNIAKRTACGRLRPSIW